MSLMPPPDAVALRHRSDIEWHFGCDPCQVALDVSLALESGADCKSALRVLRDAIYRVDADLRSQLARHRADTRCAPSIHPIDMMHLAAFLTQFGLSRRFVDDPRHATVTELLKEMWPIFYDWWHGVFDPVVAGSDNPALLERTKEICLALANFTW